MENTNTEQESPADIALKYPGDDNFVIIINNWSVSDSDDATITVDYGLVEKSTRKEIEPSPEQIEVINNAISEFFNEVLKEAIQTYGDRNSG